MLSFIRNRLTFLSILSVQTYSRLRGHQSPLFIISKSIQENNQKPTQGRRDCYQMVEMDGLDDLPRDLLIIEILSKLSTREICKIRCVSKSWNKLLAHDIEFTARHMQCCKQKPLLMVRRYLSDGTGELNQGKITIELTSIDLQGDVTDKFRQDIDGPVHTFISCGPLTVFCCTYSMYVCNPSIHQLSRVPSPANTRLYNIGFGYLPASDEYKIVHIFNHSFVGKGKMGCEVFSFGAGKSVGSGYWKTIGERPFSAWSYEHPICMNGIMFWVISSGWEDKSILSLDLKEEKFSKISYPINEFKKYSFLEYIGLMGSLCVVGCLREASTLDIWILNDQKKIWGMVQSINLSPLCPKFLISPDDQSDEIFVHMEQRDFISYSLKTRTSKSMGYYRAMKSCNRPCLYYSSLIPISGNGT